MKQFLKLSEDESVVPCAVKVDVANITVKKVPKNIQKTEDELNSNGHGLSLQDLSGDISRVMYNQEMKKH